VAVFSLYDTSGIGIELAGTHDLTDEQWHHIVAVRDANSGENRIYLDGEEEARIPITYMGNFASSAPLNIGWINNSTGYHFIGTIDEVALYNRVLAQTEIQSHYVSGLAGQGYREVTPSYTLIVNGSGNGSGTITGNGINCSIASGVVSGDCTETYNDGTDVTLSASAESGSTFSGWSGDCSGTGSCNLIMNGDKNVTAQFDIETHILTINSSGNGSGTVTGSGINCEISNGAASGDCTETYSAGTAVTLTANADTDSDFTGWTGGGCSGTGQCVVTMNSDTAVTASFSLKSFVIDASTPGGGGVISCTSPVNYGGSSTCTTGPDAHYHLSALTDNGTDVLSAVVNNTYTINNVTATHTVVAIFSIDTFTISASAPGGHGTISCTSPVSYGGTSTCTITANVGYHLQNLIDNTVDVTDLVTGNEYTIANVNFDHAVEATFAINTYTVTPSAGANGSISPSAAQTVSHGSTTSFTVTPNAGYQTVSVTGCGGTWAGTNPYITGSVTADCTVTATFSASIANVNGDSKVDIVDALLVARYAAGLPVDNFIPEAGDVNCDGEINIVDALLISRKVAGLPVPNWCAN
ncbi:MAG: LamG-like jellyroll fold domain-containing protein, partial [Nitrospirota bacterium]